MWGLERVVLYPIADLPFGGIKKADKPHGLPRGGAVGTGLDAACFVVRAVPLRKHEKSLVPHQLERSLSS